MQYFFILGRQPQLSKAEIEVVLGTKKIKFQEIVAMENFYIIETEEKLNATEIMETLGGSIKLGKIIGTPEKINIENLRSFLPTLETKINFGFSTYNCSLDLNSLGKNLKNKLKEDGIKARFVSSRENPLSSVIVKKNNLLNKGIEFVIMKVYSNFYLGQTLAVQPFEKMSDYDYGRPARDDKSGMLPPKLAQIMINLAGKSTNSTLYDPFCGSGTILQQGILLNFKKVIGSDISVKAIHDTRINLEWLANKLERKLDFFVFQSSANQANQQLKYNSVDLIVTEPYLGPALTGRENPDIIRKNTSSLAKLYQESLNILEKILNEGGVIIFVVPLFKTKKQDYKIELKKILPRNLKIADSWEYSRPGQHITRQIFKLTR